MKKIESFIENRKYIVLSSIVVLGCALRLYHINYQSLWLDELYSIVPTAPDKSLQSIIEYCQGDQPPFFFIFIHYAFQLFGYTEVVGRAACAFLGLVSIPAMYYLGKECGNKATGLFASLLTSINYFHIYFSQELRFYTAAFLFATLSYLFFIRAFKNNKIIDYLGYIVFTTALLYSHYYGLIIFGAQAATFLILLFYKRDTKFILLSITAAMIIVIAFAPWLPVIVGEVGVNLTWIKPPEFYFVAQYFYDYIGKDAVTASILLVFTYLFFKNSEKSPGQPVFYVIIIWIFLSYLVPYLRSILVSPMLVNRYTIVTLPAWIIVFAIGWKKMKNIRWRYILCLCLVLSAIINIGFVRQYYTRLKKDQFREASQVVLTRNSSQYPVFSTLAWHFSYYFRSSPSKVGEFNSENISEVNEFWLLQAHSTEEEMETLIDEQKKKWEIKETHSFFGASAVLFMRKKNDIPK